MPPYCHQNRQHCYRYSTIPAIVVVTVTTARLEAPFQGFSHPESTVVVALFSNAIPSGFVAPSPQE